MKILLVTTVVPSPALITNVARALNLPGGLPRSAVPGPADRAAVGGNPPGRRPVARARSAADPCLDHGGQDAPTAQTASGNPASPPAGAGRRPSAAAARALASLTGPDAGDRLSHHGSCRKLAERADVVVALDDPACWGVWELSRRTTGPRFVNRPGNVVQVLSAPRPAS